MNTLLLLAFLLSQADTQTMSVPPPGDSFPHLLVTRSYRAEHLDMAAVLRIARSSCRTLARGRCDWSVHGDEIELRADELTHSRFAAALRDEDRPAQVFEILLLAAGPDDGPDPELPRHAREALEDLGELLPFKGFRLLDSAELGVSGKASQEIGKTSGYRASIELRGDPESGEPLVVERFELVRKLDKEQMEAEEKEGGGRVKRERTVLSSTFSIEPGETVVVGTSKANGGDEALVVLITARKQGG